MAKTSKLKFVKNLDIFGSNKGISYNGHEEHKTILGAFVSIIYFIIVILISFHFINQALTGSPKISQGIYNQNSYFLNTTSKKFLFTFMIFNRNNSSYLDFEDIIKIFEISLENFSEENKIYTESDFSPCQNLKDFYSYYHSIGKSLNENDKFVISDDSAICLNKEIDFFWKGQPLDKIQKFTNLKFKKCHGEKCQKNLEEIIDFLEIQFFFLESHLSLGDRNYPMEYKFNKKYSFPFEKAEMKKINFFFNSVEIEDDKGIIFSRTEINKSFQLENVIPEYFVREFENEEFLSIKFSFSGKNLTILREYQKLQNVIGDIGGNTGLISVIFWALYSIYNSVKLKLYVFNKTIFKEKNIGFCTVVKFYLKKIFCSCFKKKNGEKSDDEKMAEIYFGADDELENCLDITDLIKLQGEFSIVKKAIFEEKQRILIDHYSSTKGVFAKNCNEKDEKNLLKNAKNWLKNSNFKQLDGFDKRVNFFLKNRCYVGDEEEGQLLVENNCKFFFKIFFRSEKKFNFSFKTQKGEYDTESRRRYFGKRCWK